MTPARPPSPSEPSGPSGPSERSEGIVRVGLTGGIGSGKSTVATILAECGAHVIDADVLAREVVEPGTDGLEAIAERFGPEVLGPGGALDRAALAAIVFADDAARADLDAIVHPRVRARGAHLRKAYAEAEPGAVVVEDIPLLYEAGLAADMDLVIVVTAPVETRVARAVARGMAADDIRARIAGQASDAERASIADVVLDNSGDEAALRRGVLDCWEHRIRPLIAP